MTMHRPKARMAAVAALITFAIQPARAEQPFEAVAGAWSGSGVMQTKDGPRERVRCKIQYAAKSAGQALRMDMRCATEAYKMSLEANLAQRGSAVTGNWFENEYRQGGTVSGTVDHGVIEARIEGDTITALLSVRTKANRQTLVMTSPGAWISEVTVELTRDGR